MYSLQCSYLYEELTLSSNVRMSVRASTYSSLRTLLTSFDVDLCDTGVGLKGEIRDRIAFCGYVIEAR